MWVSLLFASRPGAFIFTTLARLNKTFRVIARGLKRNALVVQELPHLSELHQIHYARYPTYETKPVVLISQADDMVDQLFEDVGAAIGPPGR
jgi:hypothetical protein